MSNNKENWFEKLERLNLLFYKYDSNLDPNPSTWDKLFHWFESFDKYFGIPRTEEIRILLSNIKETDYVSQKQAKVYICEDKKFLGGRSFDKTWKEAHNNNANRKSKAQKITKANNSKKNQLSEEEKEEGEQSLKRNDFDRYNEIREILSFDIIGEKELKNGLLIFFLQFGNCMGIYNQVGYKGESGSGKSYTSDHVIERLIPSECVYKRDYITTAGLQREEQLNIGSSVEIIYFREEPSSFQTQQYVKSMHDYDQEVTKVDPTTFQLENFKKKKTGYLSTRSFETKINDLRTRQWEITPDETNEQNARIVSFQTFCETHKPMRNIKEKEIIRKSKIKQNEIRLLRKKHKNYWIVFMDIIKEIFPTENIRIRRDTSKFRDLIGYIALYFQEKREKITIGDKTMVLANYIDFNRAFDLAYETLIDITQDSEPILRDIVNFMEFETDYTLREIYNQFKDIYPLGKNSYRNRLNKLIEKGNLEMESQGKGKSAIYRKIKDLKKPTFKLSKEQKRELEEKINQRIDQQLEYNFQDKTEEDIMIEYDILREQFDLNENLKQDPSEELDKFYNLEVEED